MSGAQLAWRKSLLKKHGISQVPVLDNKQLIGVLTEKQLLNRTLKGRLDDSIEDWVDVNFCVVHENTEIAVLNELFKRFEIALVYEGKSHVKDIITRIDLIDYVSQKRG